ncbi:MAG TPA: tetratricopeptide repeat protein, partial [Candidatus Kapabacteria bacterium]|nr:tetratricopeptide repeat protein [Candidatus Kapabacteria bacterium]
MLVGRELELAALNTAYRHMLEGRGSILFLTGEAGMGKTTLVHEWWKTVFPVSLYAEAACSIPIGNVDVGAAEALQPWADVIAHLRSHEQHGGKSIDLEKHTHEAAPAWGWAIEDSRGQDNDPLNTAVDQQQIFQQFVNLLAKISDESPLVILLDDMHWADASSTNLLLFLSRQIAEESILVLATYRPDDALTGKDGKRHPVLQVKNEILRNDTGKEITLHYLDRGSIRAVLQNVFPNYETDDELERWLEKISGGNALFVTQYITTLREDGYLDGNGKFIGEYDAITIPDSALAVVEERTARLDEATKELLCYASAEGEEFTSYVLEQLSKKEPEQLLKELQRATKAGVIMQRGKTRMFANQTTGIFGFSHALFHKALYDRLPDPQKEYLHRRCYELLKSEWERGTAQQTNTLGSKLLIHAEKCGEWAMAAQIAFTLAQMSESSAAHEEAFAMGEKCIGYAARTGNELLRANATALLGAISERSSHYEDSNTYYTNALALFEQLGNAERAIDAMSGKAHVRYRQSRFDDAVQIATTALERATTIGYKKGEANAFNHIGNAHCSLGDYPHAIEEHTQSLSLTESINDRNGQASSLKNIGNVYVALSDYKRALEYYKRALSIRESIHDKQGQAESLRSIGSVLFFLGDFSHALEHLTSALPMFESVGDRQGKAFSLRDIGATFSSLGDYARALEYKTRALTIFESIGDLYGQASALINVGNAYVVLGDNTRGLEHQSRALAIQESINDKEGQALSLLNIGETHRNLGEYAESRKMLEHGTVMAQEIGAKRMIGFGFGSLGKLDTLEARALEGKQRLERLREAAANLRRGADIYQETKDIGLKENETALAQLAEEFWSDCDDNLRTSLMQFIGGQIESPEIALIFSKILARDPLSVQRPGFAALTEKLAARYDVPEEDILRALTAADDSGADKVAIVTFRHREPPPFTYHCFGQFEITRGGVPVTLPSDRRSKIPSFIGFLLAREGKDIDTEDVLDALFGEERPENAENYLYQIVRQARMLL